MNLITCKNISFVYDGVPAVKDLDFSVEPNDYLCIVGENGAGKSTLVKGLLRLKKPASGTIHMGNGLLAKEIGYPVMMKATAGGGGKGEIAVGTAPSRGETPFDPHIPEAPRFCLGAGAST